MKFVFTSLLLLLASHLYSQQNHNLELHYDFRHSIDSKRNTKNYPTLYFEYWKGTDSGSVLVKLQGDLIGEKNNMGKCFVQVSKSYRWWKPKVFLQLEYSGGLGVTEPKEYSYSLTNAFSVGLGHPFQWKGAFFNVYSCYTYSPFAKASHDVLFSFYWFRGFMNYKLIFSGDFSVYTRNKNKGDAWTANLSGKRVSFFAEPQIWYNVHQQIAIGSRLNCYYQVLNTEPVFQTYPSVAVRYKL
jgi:hypothetical protein